MADSITPIPTVEQHDSLASIKTDPLRAFKFHVKIYHPDLVSHYPQLGFMNVTGLSMTTDVITYRQGGYNTTTQKMCGQSDFSAITMSRGMICGDIGVQKWVQQIFMVMQGTGGSDTAKDYRAKMDILIIDHPVTKSIATVKAAFRVHNAWITSIAYGDLDASGNGLMVEQMTFAHEGFQFALADKSGPDYPAVLPT